MLVLQESCIKLQFEGLLDKRYVNAISIYSNRLSIQQ